AMVRSVLHYWIRNAKLAVIATNLNNNPASSNFNRLQNRQNAMDRYIRYRVESVLYYVVLGCTLSNRRLFHFIFCINTGKFTFCSYRCFKILLSKCGELFDLILLSKKKGSKKF